MGADEDIGRRLIAVREHFEKKQSEFADILSVAKNTLSEYESGKRPLSLETARRIHARYNISLDWLLFGAIGQPRQELAEKWGPAPVIFADHKDVKMPKKVRKAS